jgi:hypothetical protein
MQVGTQKYEQGFGNGDISGSEMSAVAQKFAAGD